MSMFIMIGMMLMGISIGYIAPKHKLHKVSYLITLFIWVLLFFLGLEVGNNQQVINGLQTLGIEAVIIMLASVSGSIIGAVVLWKCIKSKK